MTQSNQPERTVKRRDLLRSGLSACVALGCGASVARPTLAADQVDAPQHFPAQAKHVIVLYMSGGYSHVDTFDPKPVLTQKHDQSIGLEPKVIVTGMPKIDRFLKAPAWKFRPNRQCGTEVSDLFPHIRDVMHEVALIRSMNSDHSDHGEATLQLHTGSTSVAMPSFGAWLSFGLGSLNPQLPSHVVLSEHRPYSGAQIWDANFLPALHSGVRILPGKDPLPFLQSPNPTTIRDFEFELLTKINQKHQQQRQDGGQLAGRIAAAQSARGLQIAAPEAFDLSQETKETLHLYGSKPGDVKSYASQCITARRLVERGVRFVEIIDAVGSCSDNWDAAHRDIQSHAKYAQRVDQPVAALITDLKRRGLLEETLLVFCTEFGRTPWAQDGKGTKSRNHHPLAFSCWLAGGGVKPGITYGQSDELGNQVAENMVHIHDFHATILRIMGLDHTRLTYRYAGRDFRLTDVHGHIVEDLLA
ncbi:DUF1501 domain-containing protein [Blastopirellula sp. J2-11]|uniref:DUF1501 domain-containing protein n=1 Tax=Blastopirellula sp. J2-11 TaxID=2943192 RepID=UPI0021C8A287|nr:DUF1501 domain-containing protein [Blastopirellula sp. J2-11]UUO07730.1 DUF1501 domain-containing protein [Blastopirellula sp. J2-11]